MSRETGEEDHRGLSIQVPIPLSEQSLFRLESTDTVLEFLARNRYESVTQTDLAANLDSSESSVQRAVDVLAANDLVDTTYDGNRKYVQIQRERLSIPDDPFLEIRQTAFEPPVKAAVEELRAALDDVVGIVLYGSVASGEADRRSDVDLWVAVRAERARNQRIANEIVAELEAQRFDGERYAFHVVVESLETIPSFTDDVTNILRSGIVLFESPEFDRLRTLLVRDVE